MSELDLEKYAALAAKSPHGRFSSKATLVLAKLCLLAWLSESFGSAIESASFVSCVREPRKHHPCT